MLVSSLPQAQNETRGTGACESKTAFHRRLLIVDPCDKVCYDVFMSNPTTIEIEISKTEVLYIVRVNGVWVAEAKTNFHAESYANAIRRALEAAKVSYVKVGW